MDKLRAKMALATQDASLHYIDAFETVSDRNRDLLGCLLLLVQDNHFICNVSSSTVATDIVEDL